MAFSKEDKEYLGLIINPIKEALATLNQQMKQHDDETSKIDKIQQQMLGAYKILGWTLLPILVSVVTWYLTKA